MSDKNSDKSAPDRRNEDRRLPDEPYEGPERRKEERRKLDD